MLNNISVKNAVPVFSPISEGIFKLFFTGNGSDIYLPTTQDKIQNLLYILVYDGSVGGQK